jgi:hypothetical protein
MVILGQTKIYTVTIVPLSAIVTYLWATPTNGTIVGSNTGSSVNVIWNTPGTDTLQVTITGCTTIVETFTETVITLTPLTANFTKINPLCTLSAGGSSLDGSIDVTVLTGMAPYTYLWNTGQTTQDRTLIGQGTYSVIITDNFQQSVTLNTTLTPQYPVPSASFSIAPSIVPAGNSSICTFTNSLPFIITVTYTGAISGTVNIPATSTAPFSLPTGTPGTFSVTVTSVQIQGIGCINTSGLPTVPYTVT